MEKERGNCLVENTVEKTIPQEAYVDFSEGVLSWSSIPLSEILSSGFRLEAGYFKIQGKHAREVIGQCKWAKKPLSGNNSFGYAYHRPRFRRIFVGSNGILIYQPSQINEVYPKPEIFISELTATDIDKLRVKENQILLTCSGTIGNVTLVSKTLNNFVFSHDVIRININEYDDIGYIYAFLKTKIGRTLITTNSYGAVVQHIEPIHLENILIPNPDEYIKKQIGERILSSFQLRDISNEFVEQAQKLLISELELAPIEDMCPLTAPVNSYEVKLSALNERFNASYHVPVVDAILQSITKTALEVTTIGDSRISERIVLPSHFKRIYSSQEQGIPLIGGKQIYELDAKEKYLVMSQYSEKLKNEITIKENMVLISAKGTVGKVVLVPKHWDGWAISSNVISVLPSSSDIAGYLYVFLSSPYGRELINRNIYGAVVDIIEPCHIAQVQIPILKHHKAQERINSLALEAKQKRYKAYVLEQEALKMVNDSVIYAQ